MQCKSGCVRFFSVVSALSRLSSSLFFLVFRLSLLPADAFLFICHCPASWTSAISRPQLLAGLAASALHCLLWLLGIYACPSVLSRRLDGRDWPVAFLFGPFCCILGLLGRPLCPEARLVPLRRVDIVLSSAVRNRQDDVI